MNKNNIGHLTDLQSKLLEMLLWFHEFCKKNKIRYYVVGGTMLGTARHAGFIPWDDDIDVGIPRKDYDRLLQKKDEYLSSEKKYTFESYLDGNKDFEYRYAKLYDKTTTLVENKRVRPIRGIFIDVFPLDGIGDNKDDAIRNYAHIKKLINNLTVKTCAIRRGRSFIKNAAVAITYLIPHRFFNIHRLIEKIDRECSKRDFDSCEYVGNLVGNWMEKEIMPREFFGRPKLYKFENIEVYGVEDYDKYLENLYHNWRQLPSIDKRKSEHDYIQLDLNKSYKID